MGADIPHTHMTHYRSPRRPIAERRLIAFRGPEAFPAPESDPASDKAGETPDAPRPKRSSPEERKHRRAAEERQQKLDVQFAAWQLQKLGQRSLLADRVEPLQHPEKLTEKQREKVLELMLKELRLPEEYDRHLSGLELRARPVKGRVPQLKLSLIDRDSEDELANLQVALEDGRITGLTRFEDEIEQHRIQKLSEYRDFLYNWAIISDALVAEIKESVKRHLKLPPQFDDRPIILTVRTTKQGITEIRATDRVTGIDFARLNLDQNQDGKIVQEHVAKDRVKALVEIIDADQKNP